MASKLEIMAELDRRGKLPADKKSLFDEAVRRGLVSGGPKKLTGVVTPMADGEQQPSTNLEMDGKQVYKGGLVENATAGLNETLYGAIGFPVDAARNVINWGIAGTNLLTGQKDLTTNMMRDDPVGGSQWISDQFAKIGVNDPDKVLATNLAERLARMGGEGAGMVIAPEMMLGALSKIGVVGPKATQFLGNIFGEARTGASMAKNAAAGAAGGVGAQIGMEVAPDELDPLAATLGGLAGGLTGAVAVEAPAMVRAAGKIVNDLASPLTKGGREQLAGRTLKEGATSPGAVVESIDNAETLVPGSKPTTFQQTGDIGLGEMERAAAAKNPGAFNTRRAEQNAARLSTIEGVQTSGDVTAVADAVRRKMQAIEQETAAAEEAALRAAQGRASAIGQGSAPDVAGDTMRQQLEAARASAKAKERELWSAVDPDGTLALSASRTKEQAARTLKETPATAKPATGEEAAIFNVVASQPEVMPFSEMTALQSRIKAELRTERMTNGETPAWRRLSQLSAAIQQDLEGAIAEKVAKDVADGLTGPGSLVEKVTGAPNAGTTVYTPAGRKIDVAYQVVEAGSPIASHTDNFQPNPGYTAALQPRNRTRAASELQVAKIAAELEPARLGASASTAEGAPIIGPDGMVESGNGRTMAIRRAYAAKGEAAAKYRQFLADQGYDVAGMQQPMLVRRRLTDLSPDDRVRFAQEAGANPVLAMSATERAGVDASRLDSDILSLYRGGDVGSAENRDFVRAFLGKVAENGEEGSFTTSGGALSLEGAARVRHALAAAAYDDAPLIEALAEVGDENIAAFGKSLIEVAGDVARLKRGIAEGKIDPRADVSPAMVEAAKFVQEARRRGVSLDHAMAQTDAFNTLSPEAFLILNAGYGAGLAGRISRSRFETFMKYAIGEAEMQTTDARLFGDAVGVVEILTGATKRYDAEISGGSRQVTDGPGDTRPRGGEAGPGDGGPPADAVGQGGAAGGAGSRDASVLQKPALEPNLDEASLGRLKEARASTKDRVETFDNKLLAPIRRRPSGVSPYDMPASAVPAKIFFAGAKSADAIKIFRKAVGDEQALSALREYAVDRLRRVAMRDDGTLDPSKVTSWRRAHSDALKAFPTLDTQLADAATASKTIGDVAAARKSIEAEAQKGAIGKLMGLDDPDDVVKTIGSIFGRKDAAKEMARLRRSTGADPQALEGLRKAVIDHITRKFVSNTEAGTSGIGTIKSDQFQTFLRESEAAIVAAGFKPDEIASMRRVALDLKQANRSISSVKLPGGSNTTQDVLATKANEGTASMLTKIILSWPSSGVSAGIGAGILGGPIVGIPVGIATALFTALRQSGVQKVDDLIRDALLDPALARDLIKRVKPEAVKRETISLTQRFARGAVGGVAAGQE